MNSTIGESMQSPTDQIFLHMSALVDDEPGMPAEGASGVGDGMMECDSDQPTRSESLKLLVVDDDEVDRMAILRALRVWKGELQIEEAATGNQALEHFAHKQFDVVLLDYRLPDMDGLDVLRMMNARRRGSTAILVLTGLDNEEIGLNCIEAGAQDFLLKKDISSRHLLRAVTHARMRHHIETELLKSHERVRDLTERDTLTGLYNRRVFEKTMRESVPRSLRHGYHLALLLLDVDNFQIINDSHGHELGDELLRVISERMQGEIRAGDLLCRMGGDEFAVLAACGGDNQSIHGFAKRLMEVLADPVVIDGVTLSPTVSIGIALTPENAQDADELLKCADLAMYRAKKGGRNCIHYYADELQQQVMRHVQTERDIRVTLKDGGFEAYYQPQISSKTGKVIGAEALLRWNHPERGVLAPGEFLDVAEDTGLIAPIGSLILQQACEDFVSGPLKDSNISVSVNLSARQLQSKGLFEQLCQVLEHTKLPVNRLVLEITESMLIENIEVTQPILQDIANLGIPIALDDFGTGYSSLSYLKQLPISILKVDRSFLVNVPNEDKDTRMLHALVSMAHQMSYDVVVEGVETEIQAQKCREIDVELQQGFYHAHPMPLGRFLNFVS